MPHDPTAEVQSPTLRSTVTCPHCWHRFAPQDILWIAAHEDLRGDRVMGYDAYLRFLPSRFDADGHAIDPRGCPCHKVACPRCHLPIPRELLQTEAFFVSIVGSPFCGKSVFLAAMTWQLRQTMAVRFCLSFSDIDPAANGTLLDYERHLFLPGSDEPIWLLMKTQLDDHSTADEVCIDGNTILLPRPFIFAVRPLVGHPAYGRAREVRRVLCLYDNAGESFLPGSDSPKYPTARHLAVSQAVLFLFDPTQDARFRQMCRTVSNDPQLAADKPVQRQDIVMQEVANRVRLYRSMGPTEQTSVPLIVVLTKFDIWNALTSEVRLDLSSVVRPEGPSMSAFDMDAMTAMSQTMRTIMLTVAPEFVAAAEAFAQTVVYVPVSGLGVSPHVGEKGHTFMVLPRDIRPMWAEVPFLYALRQEEPALLPCVPHQPEARDA